MGEKTLLLFLAILVIIKSFLWLFTIPIFQSPDEHSHFAYIQRLAETNRLINPRRDKTTSKELVEVAEILNFNWGMNHPVWQGYPKDWQTKLENIPFDNRKTFVFLKEQRGHKNPPLYYFLAVPFYKIFYNASFIQRFFSLRFFSLIISLLTVFVVYKAGFLFFGKRELAILLASLVAFQPMFSFQTVTINNDVLAIFLGTLFIYFGLQAIKTIKGKWVFLAFLTILIGLFVKPILIVLFFTFPLLLGKNFLKGFLVCFVAIFLIFFIGFLLLEDIGQPTTPLVDFLRYQITFSDYQSMLIFLAKSITSGEIFLQIFQYFKANRETFLYNLFPWYWGVFGWLEATMPLIVYRVLKVICGLSGLGLMIWLARSLKRKINKIFYMASFLISTFLIFSLGIIFNDFKVFATSGQAFGIQGRYFLPIITAHMSLLLLGLKTLVPKKFEKSLFILLIIGSVILNIVGFWTMYSYFSNISEYPEPGLLGDERRSQAKMGSVWRKRRNPQTPFA